MEASLQVGDAEQIIVEGVVSGPLSDSMRGRLAFKYNEDDGWQENRVTGENFMQTNMWGIRGHLDIDISDRVNLLLSGSYSEIDNKLYIPVVHNIFIDVFAPGTSGFINPKGISDKRCYLHRFFLMIHPDDTDVGFGLRDAQTGS